MYCARTRLDPLAWSSNTRRNAARGLDKARTNYRDNYHPLCTTLREQRSVVAHEPAKCTLAMTSALLFSQALSSFFLYLSYPPPLPSLCSCQTHSRCSVAVHAGNNLQNPLSRASSDAEIFRSRRGKRVKLAAGLGKRQINLVMSNMYA